MKDLRAKKLELGRALREVREYLKLTQQEVAQRAEVSVRQVRQLEQGRLPAGPRKTRGEPNSPLGLSGLSLPLCWSKGKPPLGNPLWGWEAKNVKVTLRIQQGKRLLLFHVKQSHETEYIIYEGIHLPPVPAKLRRTARRSRQIPPKILLCGI